MRKYCRACGASLIKKEEDPIPEPIEEPEPVAETPSFSEDAPLVRPSDVASEQADVVDDTPKPDEPIEEPPAPKELRFEPEEEVVSEPESMDDERGREVVADILEKVRAAEARTKDEEDADPSDTELEPPPAESLEEEAPLVSEESEVEPEVEEQVVTEPEPIVPEPVVAEAPTEVAPPTPVEEDASIVDEKVRNLENDINAFNIELGTLRSEFDTLRTHLDEEADRYHTVAEVKRIRVESVERDLDLAKKEHSDASKEYKNVENRRKKELSEAEKRIREVEKRLKKAEESKEKRIEDLEKERRKREEEARKS